MSTLNQFIPNSADYTAARAAKIDNLDATVATRAAAATALSNVTWTAALAAILATLDPAMKIKTAASGITAQLNQTLMATYGVYFRMSIYGVLIGDKTNGYRAVMDYSTSRAALSDVLNVSGSGWVLGCCVMNNSGTTTYSVQGVLTIDGVTVCDTGYNSRTALKADILLGMVETITTVNPGVSLLLSPVPIRFESSLQFQVKNSNGNAGGTIVYLLD